MPQISFAATARALLLASCMSLAGCSGGGSAGTAGGGGAVIVTPTPTPVPVPTPTPTPTPVTPAGVSAVTTLDFTAVADYANPALPAYYDATVNGDDNTPPNNAIDNRIATLGRVLFYDKRLSTTDTVSCVSCHQQALGFTDSARFSAGINGGTFTNAHAMRLGNVRYYRPGSMFWDKRAASVELQASQPIQNAVEMGWTPAAGGISALTVKLGATSFYPDLFTWAFGTPMITEPRIQFALAQFERAMVSYSSKWDTGYAAVFSPTGPNRNLNVDFPNFTAQENRGRQLFMSPPNAPGGGAGCAACHVPPTFALAANSQGNGLDAGETIAFKSPSLKSIGLTGPYMHDGRFATLLDVVIHYDTGIQLGPALDNRLRLPGGAPMRLNLSAADRAALVAFLLTLSDTVLIADPKFGSPFRP
ncbi:c-type cytochrome [Sphingomonas sp. LB-2]|uniref:cytochrome-c peroxidase n=1 Tax=Sphingomonas caeni TaxID=2984949 RepID=UPI00222E4A38|nr:cytochrome c peroxidase [Sphingomonas caeni]MCW3849010.1 c-type cytochrome [Sphingomonas caeni]